MQKDSNNCLYIYTHTILKMIPRFMKKRIKKRNQTRKNKCSRTKSKGGNDEIKTQNKHIRILQKCLNEFITTEEDYCKTLISAIRFTTKLQTNKTINLIDAIQKELTIQGIKKKLEQYDWKDLPTKEHMNFFFLDIIYTLVHNKKQNHIKKLLRIKKNIFTTYEKIIEFGREFLEKLKPIVGRMQQIQLLSSQQTDTSPNADKTPMLSSSLIDNVCEKKTQIRSVLDTFITTLQELFLAKSNDEKPSIADCYEGYPLLHASITAYIKLYQEHIAQTKQKTKQDISHYVIDILSRPIQRWLRYILLCQELLKHIPQYTDIQQQLGTLINNLKVSASKMDISIAPNSTRKSRRKNLPIGVRQWFKKLRTRKNAVVPIDFFRN